MIYRKIIFILFTLISLIGTTTLAHSSSTSDNYSTLLSKVKNGDTNIDFKAFRIAYTQTPLYNPYNVDDSTQVIRAINEKNYSQMLKYANIILEKNFTDLDAHYASMIAYEKLGDQKRFNFHRTVFFKLLDSIIKSGDGKAPETAVQVITIREEYMAMLILQLKQNSRTSKQIGEKSYDISEVFDTKNNQTHSLYFDISIPFDWLNEKLINK
jgi:hypothetical protein